MLWREAVRSYSESGHRIATAGLVSTADNSSYRNLSNARFTPQVHAQVDARFATLSCYPPTSAIHHPLRPRLFMSAEKSLNSLLARRCPTISALMLYLLWSAPWRNCVVPSCLMRSKRSTSHAR